MVLDKSIAQLKRRQTDQNKGAQSKKKKSSTDDDDGYPGSSLFARVCRETGVLLNNGNLFNQLSSDVAVIQRSLGKDLRKHGAESIVDEFVEGFQEYIEEPKRFHKSLLPSTITAECVSARGGLQSSIVKILFGVDLIQPHLMSALLEKLPEFTGEDDCSFMQQGQKVNVPHLLLSQFQWLDNIVNSKDLCEKLLEMLTITCTDVQREIIACLPDIIQDSEHAHVASALRDVLSENKELTVPVLDAMSNLILTPQILTEVRESVLQSLASVDLEDLPVLVKFLLQSVTAQDALEVVTELRANLEFDSTTVKKAGNNKRRSSGQDTESLVLETIHSAVRFQKNVGDALIKTIETVKQPAQHKVLDLFLLLILHNTPRKKVVESVFRNKIRAACFTEAYLKQIFDVHSQVLKVYFQSIQSLAEVLLRSPEMSVTYFGSALYKCAFLAFDAYHQQELVGNLVTHIGSGLEGEVDSALDILSDLVNKHLQKMAPFAILVKSVLDYLDNLSVTQIRKLYFMLSALAFKNPQEGGLIQDDLHIVIRKQLSNNTPKYKRMGVIGAVMIVNCIASQSAEATEEDSCSEDLSDDLLKQVTSLLTLVRSSSSKSPEAYSLFMDELSSVIAHGQLNSKVEHWISENLTLDFQESFVVDISDQVAKETGNIPLELLHTLDDDAEGGIAINLLPLVVTKYSKRTALTCYMEGGLTDPVVLCPSVRLLRVIEERQHGTLENIDALLGCPVYLTKECVYEKLSPLSQREKEIILSSLFYCINWFIEMVNGFSSQDDPEVKGKVIARLQNITHLQKLLIQCLAVTPGYKPPLANFDLEDNHPIQPASAGTSSGNSKKKKGKKPKKGQEKEKVTSDSDDNSRDSSQLNNTTVVQNTQAAPSQLTDSGENDTVSVNISAYKPFFRELDISVFAILNTGLITKAALDSDMNTKGVTELSLQTAQVNYLMEDLCRKLDHSLLASASKRKSFFKVKGEKKVGFSHLDQLSPLEVATKVVQLLPALCNHLEGASGFFQALIAENDGVMDGPGSHSPESLMMASCFQQLLQALLSIFSWNGFEIPENRELLKEGLQVLVRRIKPTGSSQLPLNDLLKGALKYLSNFSGTVPDITTAVSLLKLLTSLSRRAECPRLHQKIAPLAEEFLKREWLGPDGQREKGAKYNEQLQMVLKTFILHSEDRLTAVETIATKAIPELLQADKNGCSESFPSMTRSSYPVYYKVLFSELVDVVKTMPLSKPTETLDVWTERLLRWNVAVRILQILVNLIKTFDGRSNLGTCIKYGRFFVEAFLRLGMPLLDKMFRNHRADIHGLLKNLQLSTRTLHHICGHSKIMKDVSLTNQVPMMKRSLEVFVFRVKSMLTVNKCLEAFWMGNLKNRDLQGEEILSQTTEPDASTAGDSDAETLPDDDDLSDVELDNESNESNETRDNDVTDPEGSYSQVY